MMKDDKIVCVLEWMAVATVGILISVLLAILVKVAFFTKEDNQIKTEAITVDGHKYNTVSQNGKLFFIEHSPDCKCFTEATDVDYE